MPMTRATRYRTPTDRLTLSYHEVTEERLAQLLGPAIPPANIPLAVRTLIDAREYLIQVLTDHDNPSALNAEDLAPPLPPMPAATATPPPSAQSPVRTTRTIKSSGIGQRIAPTRYAPDEPADPAGKKS